MSFEAKPESIELTTLAESASTIMASALQQAETNTEEASVIAGFNAVQAECDTTYRYLDIDSLTEEQKVIAARENNISIVLSLHILPSSLPQESQRKVVASLLDRDEKISRVLRDPRSIEEKGAVHYQRLLRTWSKSAARNR